MNKHTPGPWSIGSADNYTRRTIVGPREGMSHKLIARMPGEYRENHAIFPKNFPVRPLRKGQAAKDKVTCGYCGLSWDDGKATEWTPAPSGRCPFEYFHTYKEA